MPILNPSSSLLPMTALGAVNAVQAYCDQTRRFCDLFPREKFAHGAQQFCDYYIFVGIAIAWLAWYTPGGYHTAQAYIPALLGGPGWNFPDAVLTLLKKDSTWLDWLIHIVLEQAGTFFPFTLVTIDAAKWPAGMQHVLLSCNATLGTMRGIGQQFPQILSVSDLAFALGVSNTAGKKILTIYNKRSNPADDHDKKMQLCSSSLSELLKFFGAVCAGLSMIAFARVFVLAAPILYSLSGLFLITAKSETIRSLILQARNFFGTLRTHYYPSRISTSINNGQYHSV